MLNFWRLLELASVVIGVLLGLVGEDAAAAVSWAMACYYHLNYQSAKAEADHA
jgi:hypothetical protein